MVKRKEGTIINVASIAGLNPSRLAGLSYSAAKAAVINFTGFLNEELRNTGVRVSVVVPGEVDTPIMDKRPVPPSRESRSTMVTAEDVADAIFLIANLPQRASVPELVIRPTYLRDFTAEVGVS
jgi:short-subunit dehydrogenase